jgi:D-alanyl-D-alanine carboxypeptidase
MKNFFKYSAVALIGVFVASFFTIPAFNQEVRYFILANVVGGQFCPQGDGKTFDNELLVHVNKTVSLPYGYTPEKLVDISKEIKSTQRICLKREALDALKVMFADAQAQNINLAVTSAFRSSQTQSNLFKALYALKGEKAKDRIASAGHSEHQLGTTVDLSGKSINYVSASDRFTGTVEELWLKANAHKYGFVQSYPKDKTGITGYDHESWHYRYLGGDVAQKVYEEGITTEEYFANLDKQE